MLEKFAKAKRAEIESLKELEARGAMPAPLDGPRPSLARSIRDVRAGSPVAVIAEYKRASPSKGVIRLDLTPEDVCGGYAAAGAAGLSVLTEETYFQGSLDYLNSAAVFGLPLLRKDFIFHPLQIRRTAATPASAVLLIARMVPGERLKELHCAAFDAGLEAVVEIFDRDDLALARSAGASIIQVNNRDLDTLDVDLGLSRDLAREKRDGETWIAASGMTTGAEAAEMAGLGFDAVLVGSHLMAQGDPGQALAAFIGQAGEKRP